MVEDIPTNNKKIKPELRLTNKAWKKFDYPKQRELLKRFDVIISDHSTRKERLARILKTFNKTNFDRGVVQFQKSLDSFSREMEKLHDSLDDGKRVDLEKQFWGKNNRDAKEIFWGRKSFKL